MGSRSNLAPLPNFQQRVKKKVCIVGGGPAGLVSLRRVLGSVSLTGTLFEQKDDIGGLWNYKGEKTFTTSSRHLDPTKNGIEDPENTTTMYDDLRCNLPFPLMEFLDFGHPRDKYTFATQPELHKYLTEYSKHFNLRSNIRLNTAVVDIRPASASDDTNGKWVVETHNHKLDVYTKEVFDAVMICAGKDSYPYPVKPEMPGLENFQGKVLHCKYFKNGREFQGKNVTLIGLGPTSADLALVISKFANKVTICHKFPYGFHLGLLPHNAREVKNVKLVKTDGAVTEEDEFIPSDVIILCTGYALKFPFLNPSCGVTVLQNKYVPNLYNMTVYAKRPTLSFLNLCYRSPEYVLTEIQARYVVSILEGKTKLPSLEEMEATVKSEEAEKEMKGIPLTLWFQVGDFGRGAWKYFWKIAEDTGIRHEYSHGPLLEHVYNTTVERLFGTLTLCKQDTIKVVIEKFHWELTLHASPEFPDSKAEKITMKLNPDMTINIDKEEI